MRNFPKGAGFSLIEMLIGLALLSIILTLVTTLTTSTMSYSMRTTGDADRMGELNSASGYIGDNLRRALAVSTNLTVNPSVNGGTCSLSAGTTVYPACVAILVPEARHVIASEPDTKIDTYLILVYRVERRSELSSNYKTVDSWADTNTFVIMEYRKVLCQDIAAVPPSTMPTPCDQSAQITQFTNATSIISDTGGSVVMDSLTLDPSVGSSLLAPLAYNSTSKRFVLILRTKRLERGDVIYTPRGNAQVFNILRRN